MPCPQLRSPRDEFPAFDELIYRRNSAHAGLIRLPDVPAQRRIELVAAVINRHRLALENRAIVTIRGARIRVSHPPINCMLIKELAL